MSLIDRIRSIFSFDESGGPSRDTLDVGKRYRHFRTLLTANNNALELMAEMQQTLQDSQPYSMSFIRGHCTAMSVNIYKMVTSLLALSGGKHSALTERFTAITSEIEATLDTGASHAEGPFIIPLSGIDRGSADQAGEKMSNLGEVGARLALKIPDGFVITASAGRSFLNSGGLQDEINRRLKTLDENNLEELFTTSAAIQQTIINAPMPDGLVREITAAYDGLMASAGDGVLVAMRSSAIGEDGGHASFAGQYRTHLNVDRDFLLQSYKEILAGKYKGEAIVYRNQRGFRHQDVYMCVGCMVMVDAAVSGVAYSRSPSDLRSEWVEITATRGLADAVVTGRGEMQQYRVSRQTPELVLYRPDAPQYLDDGQAREIARIAVLIERHFGVPQDIEWSIDTNGELFILQSRPIPASTLIYSTDGSSENNVDEKARLWGGTTASRGVAVGGVFIVRSAVDMLSFPSGAVLVVEAPLPEYAAIAPRAVAIISETGNAAAHLATVAREFGVPALFGLKQATERLQTAEEITVDASGRKVYEGHNEALLSMPIERPSLMRGSPVERILTNVMAKIAPLNMTDPGSAFFRPSSCETLHDITRFCHEKAVAEMFSISRESRRDHADAKQLIDQSAYHWWILNLDDGFSAQYDKKQYFVKIEDIVSVPMRALWEGMTALPWQGPPPVDLRGFGSILFRSTMNPHLDPAVRSNLNDRNYFLVSKNFCNLSVRLGYHFALAEAHIGDLLTENYVSFTFKGGAADKNRRLLRVQLLGDILGQYGFRTEQKLDALSARIEKKPAKELIQSLRILGYLVIHTRQIDMVMEDGDAVERYRSKLVSDIESVILKLPEAAHA